MPEPERPPINEEHAAIHAAQDKLHEALVQLVRARWGRTEVSQREVVVALKAAKRQVMKERFG